MNAKIDPAVECQRDILIELQAAGQIDIQTGPCVRHIFGISGPAFHITKEVHSLAQGIRVCGGEGRLLIEMSGIAFMGQCRKKGQIVSNLAVIQVNHIAVSDPQAESYKRRDSCCLPMIREHISVYIDWKLHPENLLSARTEGFEE